MDTLLRNIIFIAFSIGVYFILKRAFGEKDEEVSYGSNKIYAILSFILAIGLIFGTQFWGTKVPGSFFERSKYETMSFVYISPQYGGSDWMYVPAKIIAYQNEEGPERLYDISYVIMPNGDKIRFERYSSPLRADYDYSGLITQEKTFDFWKVRMTSKPVRDP